MESRSFASSSVSVDADTFPAGKGVSAGATIAGSAGAAGAFSGSIRASLRAGNGMNRACAGIPVRWGDPCWRSGKNPPCGAICCGTDASAITGHASAKAIIILIPPRIASSCFKIADT